jgi:hypothetical protein
MLADQIVDTFEQTLHGRFDTIASVLVLRDGRLCGREIEGIDRAVDRLKGRSMLTPDALVDVVDIRKDTLKALRVWEVDEDNPDKVENPLEGLAVGRTPWNRGHAATSTRRGLGGRPRRLGGPMGSDLGLGGRPRRLGAT